MKITRVKIEGLILIELSIYHDERGFFTERFKRSAFEDCGLPASFVQENHSRSAPGVIRGLHYQYLPAQGKLVGVVRGRILDVAVDIRPWSATYGQNFSVELNDSNGRLMWIPAGFAHGFCVLGDEPADVVYKTDAEYNPASENGINYSDSDLAIEWQSAVPQVSERDQHLQSFAQYKSNPIEWNVENSHDYYPAEFFNSDGCADISL